MNILALKELLRSEVGNLKGYCTHQKLLTFNQTLTKECEFEEWVISNKSRAKLIEELVYLYLRKEEKVQKLIDTLEPRWRVLKVKLPRML
ncbi:hypothetical protein I5F01_02540 [Proteus mirabilis]|nr:hypothetical protein [Proteus mirabilis]HEK0526349.1 hypothetical protein [Proteus mirabilis]